MEITYSKLVRDNIPEIIEASNKTAVIRIADNEETQKLLFKKLIEELNEFKETPNEEELADILEVVDGIAKSFNLDIEKAKSLKAQKKVLRGGFEKGIVLEKVIEEEGK